jgi:threonine/homoserine/homoserine lactone efflux protein
MNIETWLAFCAASIVLLIIPGPTILAVISYSISHGLKAKIPLILAVALGDSTALLLSLLGLGTLLAKSVFWFQVIKWIGGLYLIYLGIKLLKEGFSYNKNSQSVNQNNAFESSWRLFVNTYLVTALNPKGMVFFIAFLPQFINHSTPDAALGLFSSATAQLTILAISFVMLATLNATLYAVFATKAQAYLASAKTQRIFNVSGGTLMCIAGSWALASK